MNLKWNQIYLTGLKILGKYIVSKSAKQKQNYTMNIFLFKLIIHMEFLFFHLIENIYWKCLGFYVSFWSSCLVLTGTPNFPNNSLEGSPCEEPGEGVEFYFYKAIIKHIMVINNSGSNNYYCFLNLKTFWIYKYSSY